MIGFALRRLVSAIVVLWIVMTGVFLLVHVLGDPARATLGEKAQTEQLEAFRKRPSVATEGTSPTGGD